MIFAHKSSVNCLVKSGCLNYKPPLGDELRKTVQSNLIDRAGEDDVNTLGVRYRCLRRGSSTAENTDIDMSPSLSRSSRMKQTRSSQDAPNDVSLENGSKRRSIIKDVPHEGDRGRVIEDSEDGEGSRRKRRKRHSHNKMWALKVSHIESFNGVQDSVALSASPDTRTRKPNMSPWILDVQTTKRTCPLTKNDKTDPIECTEDEASVQPSETSGTEKKRGRKNHRFDSRRKSNAVRECDIRASGSDTLIIAKHEWIIFGDRLREQENQILSHDEHIRNIEKSLIEKDDRLCKLETEYSELKQIVLEVGRKQALVVEHDQRTEEAIPLSSTSMPFQTGDGESSAKEA
ncbi:hypothetical protein AA0119_g12880 [Alternaria tenuissima]|uniref:Uncharacterized protein n=2 Tax=Alternaria alternata complex TaxID=187734 RepID=A0A4Q4MYE3_ALTAL|nr:hypothetical protein AA0117_g12706 [Alternaria alternata]RYN86458.1 hypothetical protein AA0119_g12880 [Alternaria tenuissima]RYO04020.1 hypothetical protein AA0121_g12887 [Alternaria tenuissima]